jgi:hypothetical protein
MSKPAKYDPSKDPELKQAPERLRDRYLIYWHNWHDPASLKTFVEWLNS